MTFELTSLSFFQVTQALPTRHPTPCLSPALPLIHLLRVGTETSIKPLHQASTWATIKARLLSCISLVPLQDRSMAATREPSPQPRPGLRRRLLQGSPRDSSTSHRQDRGIQERSATTQLCFFKMRRVNINVISNAVPPVSRFLLCLYLDVRRIIHAPLLSWQ